MIEDGVLYSCLGIPPETLDIPEGVTRIEEGVFQRYGDEEATIQTVNLPESLESIGAEAFANQSALETVNGLGESVDIGLGAFTGTAFQRTAPFRLLIKKDNVLTGFLGECPETLEIPDGVVEIGDNAFNAEYYGYVVQAGEEGGNTLANLRKVSIPASVQKIGRYAFHGCGLETVTIANPDVIFSGEAPFFWCFDLASIEMAKDGYVQDAWLVTFDIDNVYAWPDGDGDGWLLPNKAGDTMLLPADDLTCLMYYIEVTDSEGNVGYLEPGDEEYDEETDDYI